MIEDRPLVEKAAAEIARRQGYRVQQSADAFAGRKLYMSYRSVLNQEERIEVDLNFLFRMPLGGTATRELWQPGGLDRPRVPVVSTEEILVGKILALLDRGAARDVWDVANLPSAASDVLESRLFRVWLIALVSILDHPLTTYTRDRLEARITDRVVSEQLAPMLATNVPIPSRELVKSAWEVVGRFLSLTPNEEEFIAAIQRGELRPERLLPDDAEEVERIANHPAIRWKIANVRAHLAKSDKKREARKPSRRPA
jgi:predicted nucleotidyltransferase component of viral defense system